MINLFLSVFKRSCNKVLCITMTVVMLFNLTTPVFAGYQAKNKQEEQVLNELNQALQEEYTKQKDPYQKDLERCLNEEVNIPYCAKYINSVNKFFKEAREKAQSDTDEQKKAAISKREYTKHFTKSVNEEYQRSIDLIENEYKTHKQNLEYKYQSVPFNSPDYTNYIFDKSTLDNWKKEALTSLEGWTSDILDNIDKYYKEDLVEHEKSQQAYLTEYLKETAENLMSVFDKVGYGWKVTMLENLVTLLAMESEDVKFFNPEQRSKLHRFFSEVVRPKKIGKQANPCRLHTRQKTEKELELLRSFDEKEARIERDTRELGGLSVRDQVAAQTRGIRDGIRNQLQGPITEIEDEKACTAAFTALNGLSFFRNWDMSSVLAFMIDNATEPTASQVLPLGLHTLLETNRLDLFYSLILHMREREIESKEEDDLKLKEAIFYKGRFYKTPYAASRYAKEDGGGDAWQDAAKILSQEKNPIVEEIQHKILNTAVSFGNGKAAFGNNLPFVYGMLLYSPKVIDTFVPSSVTAYSYRQYKHSSTGGIVRFKYDEETDSMDMYIQTKNGKVSINDSDKLVDLESNAILTAGNIRMEMLEASRKIKDEKKKEYFNYFKEKRGGLKPSAFYAEVFYKADFIDLSVEEKLAMDKALAEKYPHLKTLSANHKKDIEKNRRNAGLVEAAIITIDVGFTLWCFGDIIKLGKWGMKGFKTLRAFLTVRQTAKGLSTVRRIRFLRNIAKVNPEVVKLHRRVRKLQTMPQRISARIKKSVDSFNKIFLSSPKYTAAPVGMAGQRYAAKYYAKDILNVKPAETQTGVLNILDKKGRTKSYRTVHFNEEGILEVDGDLFKTYKATMKGEDIAKYDAMIDETIANLERELAANEDRIAFLSKEYLKKDALSAADLAEYERFKQMAETAEALKGKHYVTLRFDNKKLTIAEKFKSRKKEYELVNLYDAQGQVMTRASLDTALDGSQEILRAVEQGEKLIFKDGKVYLGSKVLDVSIGAPKETITLLAKSGRKVEDFAFMTFKKTPTKLFTLIFNNALTFSAASSSLNMSLNQAPFSIPREDGNKYYVSQGTNMLISLAAPYALSFLSPMVTPFVKRFGASNVQVFSLGIATLGMSYAAFSGYSGQATFERDENGNVVYDENGKAKKASKAPSYKPLIVAAFLSGLSSSMTRASLNVAIKEYQVSKATMATSMIAKNIGSLFMTIIPAAAESYYGKDNVDFSISYPILGGLAVLGGASMFYKIPSSVAREAGYKIALRNGGEGYLKSMLKPFSLFSSSKVAPYYISFLSFGATESYSLFKVFNTFTRDTVDNVMKDTNSSKNQNKLIASTVATIPSAIVRLFAKRKANFTQGIMNNVLLTSAGMVLLMMPSEKLSNNANLAIGTTSGILLGMGTANMYQYLQKNMLLSSSKDMALVRRYGGRKSLATTAQSFYSGANIGLALPYAYSLVAETQKIPETESDKLSADFKANQYVLPLSSFVYGLGVLPLLRWSPIGKSMVISKFATLPFGAYAVNDLTNGYTLSLPITPKLLLNNVDTSIKSLSLPAMLKFDLRPIKYNVGTYLNGINSNENSKAELASTAGQAE